MYRLLPDRRAPHAALDRRDRSFPWNFRLTMKPRRYQLRLSTMLNETCSRRDRVMYHRKFDTSDSAITCFRFVDATGVFLAC